MPDRSTARLSAVWRELEARARELGAVGIGATPIEDRHAGRMERWLADGLNAGMEYLRRHVAVRLNPGERYPWARSVVAILVPYSHDRPTSPPDNIAARIARYAQGDDYHDVLDSILKELEDHLARHASSIRTWRYVDTGPLSDRSMAAQAGLGWIGRNGMLIDPEHGSYNFIGLLLTSLECDINTGEVADRCGDCTRCVDLCPTTAILPDRFVDANRCISYATIEHRGALDAAMAESLSGNLFGCDICQEVCPWNAQAPAGHDAFLTRAAYTGRPVTDLLTMTQAGFSTLFSRSAVKRAKRAGMIRNAVLVLDTIPAEAATSLDAETDDGIRAALALRRGPGSQ